MEDEKTRGEQSQMSVNVEKKQTRKAMGSLGIQILMQVGASLAYVMVGVIVSFWLIRLGPGSPSYGVFPPDEGYYDQLGLGEPLWTQFFIFLKNFMSGNWGYSTAIVDGQAVFPLMWQRIPRSIGINVMGVLLAMIWSWPLAHMAADDEDASVNRKASLVARLGFALPVLGVGVFLRYIFTIGIGIFPQRGYYSTLTGFYGDFTYFPLIECLFAGQINFVIDILYHLVLPGLTMSIFYTSILIPLIQHRNKQAQKPLQRKVYDKSSLWFFNFGLIFLNTGIIERIFSINGGVSLLFEAFQDRDYLVLIHGISFLIVVVVLVILVRNLSQLLLIYRKNPKMERGPETLLFSRLQTPILVRDTNDVTPFFTRKIKQPLFIIGLSILGVLFVGGLISRIIGFMGLSPVEESVSFRQLMAAIWYLMYDAFLITVLAVLIGGSLGLAIAYLRVKEVQHGFILASNIFFIIPPLFFLGMFLSTIGVGGSLHYSAIVMLTLLGVILIFQASLPVFRRVLDQEEYKLEFFEAVKKASPTLVSMACWFLIWVIGLKTCLNFFAFSFSNFGYELGYYINSTWNRMMISPMPVLLSAFFIILPMVGAFCIQQAVNHSGKSSQESN